MNTLGGGLVIGGVGDSAIVYARPLASSIILPYFSSASGRALLFLDIGLQDPSVGIMVAKLLGSEVEK